jgi:hypothetical protein
MLRGDCMVCVSEERQVEGGEADYHLFEMPLLRHETEMDPGDQSGLSGK